jgi:hypothetical protein
VFFLNLNESNLFLCELNEAGFEDFASVVFEVLLLDSEENL